MPRKLAEPAGQRPTIDVIREAEDAEHERAETTARSRLENEQAEITDSTHRDPERAARMVAADAQASADSTAHLLREGGAKALVANITGVLILVLCKVGDVIHTYLVLVTRESAEILDGRRIRRGLYEWEFYRLPKFEVAKARAAREERDARLEAKYRPKAEPRHATRPAPNAKPSIPPLEFLANHFNLETVVVKELNGTTRTPPPDEAVRLVFGSAHRPPTGWPTGAEKADAALRTMEAYGLNHEQFASLVGCENPRSIYNLLGRHRRDKELGEYTWPLSV